MARYPDEYPNSAGGCALFVLILILIAAMPIYSEWVALTGN